MSSRNIDKNRENENDQAKAAYLSNIRGQPSSLSQDGLNSVPFQHPREFELNFYGLDAGPPIDKLTD